MHILDTATLKLRALDLPGAMYGAPKWSPDGRELACSVGSLDGQSALLVTDVARGATRSVPLDELVCVVFPPAWSGDGRQVAIPGNYRGGEEQVWLADLGTGSAEQVCSFPSEMMLVGVAFGGNERDLYFALARKWVTPESASVYRCGLDGREHTEIVTLTAAPDWSVGLPCISPDGRGIATGLNSLRRPGEPREAVILWAREEERGRIPIPADHDASVVAWSPDSKLLAVSYAGERGTEVAVYELPIVPEGQ
jgi:Tol biopolymer transport system component